MNFLINVDFNDTHTLSLVLIDPDPEGITAVYSALFDGGKDIEVAVFFEAPQDAEVWEILALCLKAYKEVKLNEGLS